MIVNLDSEPWRHAKAPNSSLKAINGLRQVA